MIGQLMRGTDRLLDVLHGIYERLIHWVFSDRRYRVLRAAAPGLRPGRSTPTARRDRDAPRRWRFATITPRAIVLLAGIASFVAAIALAPLVGTEFIPESRQQLHPAST